MKVDIFLYSIGLNCYPLNSIKTKKGGTKEKIIFRHKDEFFVLTEDKGEIDPLSLFQTFNWNEAFKEFLKDE